MAIICCGAGADEGTRAIVCLSGAESAEAREDLWRCRRSTRGVICLPKDSSKVLGIQLSVLSLSTASCTKLCTMKILFGVVLALQRMSWYNERRGVL